MDSRSKQLIVVDEVYLFQVTYQAVYLRCDPIPYTDPTDVLVICSMSNTSSFSEGTTHQVAGRGPGCCAVPDAGPPVVRSKKGEERIED